MRRRLILSYLALTFVVVAALEVPLGISFADHQQDELASGLQRDAFVLASSAAETLSGNATLDLDALASGYARRTGGRVVFVDSDARLVADSDPPVEGQRSFASRPEIAAALDRQITTGTRLSNTLGEQLFYVSVPVMMGDSVVGAVRITYSTGQLDEQVHRYWYALAGVGVVAMLAAAGVGALFARWVSVPVEELTQASRRLGEGDLTTRSSTPYGPPEIRDLAHAFNVTAGRLQELITAQEDFVADASHQLRTPLTALRLRLEMLEGSLQPGQAVDEEAVGDLAAAHHEVQRLSRLVDGLLALARAERKAPASDSEHIRASELLHERHTTWEPLASERGVSLVVEETACQLRATPDRLTQVLDNLIANALDASSPGDTITLSCDPVPDDPRLTEIRVTDEGPGLTAAQRDQAFIRFWRGDPGDSRPHGSDELGGSGLGLAIVKKLVNSDGGTVRLDESPSGGISAVVVLAAGDDRS